MKDNFEIYQKKVHIYFNGKKVIDDVFDYLYNYDNFVIAYNSNKLIIINPNGEVIFSKFGKVTCCTPRRGKYIVMEDVHKQLGMIKYDGSTFIPFKFYAIVFLHNGTVSVKRKENSEWEDNYAECI